MEAAAGYNDGNTIWRMRFTRTRQWIKMKQGTKYYPLYEFLRQNGQDEVKLGFGQIEALIGRRLPDSARATRGWWSNRSTGAAQATAWMDAGYHVAQVDLEGEQAVFRRPAAVYVVQRVGDFVLWDSDTIRGLRHHLGMTQAELADEIGVRQQTISEWETGLYLPKRALSKVLRTIAERAEFPYTTSNET